MKAVKYLVVALMIVGLAGISYAAPVGLTSQNLDLKSDLLAKENYGVTLAVIGDFVSERNIDIDSGELSVDSCFARIGATALDRFEVYVDFGSTFNTEYKFAIQGEDYKIDYDDELVWGVGGSALIYKWENGIEVGAMASYREADLTIDTVSLNGISYTLNAGVTNVSDSKYSEWQVAAEVAWKTEYITPYVALKYSDVELGSSFTLTGFARDAKDKNSAENVGIVVGASITPKISGLPASEQIAINVEGRFIDEEAINVGVTYRF